MKITDRTADQILSGPTATVQETARTVLQVSPGKVYELARTGQLDSIRVGRRVLIKTDSLHRLLNAGDAA
jgi:excisionase family DNA binding protein